MAIGAKEDPILGHWLLPIRGVVQSIDDLFIPMDGLFSASNVEIVDGTLRGRRGLTPLPSSVPLGSRPLGAVNFWNSQTSSFVVIATAASIWSLELATNIPVDRVAGLTAGPDDATRVIQFAFGTPVLNRAYVCNGKDPFKVWKVGDATASSVRLVKNDTVSFAVTNSGNGVFTALPTLGASAQLGTYSIVCTNITVPATFSVNAPDGTTLANLTVGVAYTGTHFSGTLNAGTVAWALNDLVRVVVTDAAPIFRDVTVSADRIVGLVGSHGIRWGEPLDDQTWPALNQKLFTETPAPTMACRFVVIVGISVYKKDSVWLGETTGAAGAAAFKFAPLFWMEGPAGPNAVVEAGGKHIYMTSNGRVAMFTGHAHKWITDGTWPVVKAEIDTTTPNRIHGVYIRQQEQVWFSYKRTGTPNTDGLLIVQLERPETRKPFAAFPGRWGKSITASCSIWADNIDFNMVFASNTGAEKVYQMTGIKDDDVSISSFMQTGLIAGQHKFELFYTIKVLHSMRALSVEPFIERKIGFGSVAIMGVTSNVLEDMIGKLSGKSFIDLSTVPVKEVIGIDAKGRFLGVRMEWDSTATVRYRGIVLRAPYVAPETPRPA